MKLSTWTPYAQQTNLVIKLFIYGMFIVSWNFDLDLSARICMLDSFMLYLHRDLYSHISTPQQPG